jgi:hypothetical protein
MQEASAAGLHFGHASDASALHAGPGLEWSWQQHGCCTTAACHPHSGMCQREGASIVSLLLTRTVCYLECRVTQTLTASACT